MIRVLIIDDNPQFVNLFKEYFSNDYLVYSHTDFKDVDDIMSKALQILPNVIILDINLVKADGLDVARRFQDDSSLKKIPIILLTASDYNTVVESLVKKEPNIVGFYSKLSSLDLIKEKIDSLFKG